MPGKPKDGFYQMFSTISHGKACEYEIVVADEDIEHEPEVVIKFRVKGVRAACDGLHFTVARFEFGNAADKGTMYVADLAY